SIIYFSQQFLYTMTVISMSKMFTGALLECSVNSQLKKDSHLWYNSFDQTNQKGGILMINNINSLPTLKEIESNLFGELQEMFQTTLLSILDEVDIWLRDNRDFERFENREMQET